MGAGEAVVIGLAFALLAASSATSEPRCDVAVCGYCGGHPGGCSCTQSIPGRDAPFWRDDLGAESPLVSDCIAGWARCPYAVVGGPVVEVWR